MDRSPIWSFYERKISNFNFHFHFDLQKESDLEHLRAFLEPMGREELLRKTNLCVCPILLFFSWLVDGER